MAELQTVAMRVCVDCLVGSDCSTPACALHPQADPDLFRPLSHQVLSDDEALNAAAAYESYRRHRNRIEGAQLPPWPEVPSHKQARFMAIARDSVVSTAAPLTADEVKALRGARNTAHVVALACNEGSPARLEEEARVAVIDRLLKEVGHG